MKVLLQGQQSLKRVELLLKLTSIKSDDMKSAITSYLVGGINETAASALNNVDRNNLVRSLTTLNEKAKIVEAIKEIDWAQFKAEQKATTCKEVI